MRLLACSMLVGLLLSNGAMGRALEIELGRQSEASQVMQPADRELGVITQM